MTVVLEWEIKKSFQEEWLVWSPFNLNDKRPDGLTNLFQKHYGLYTTLTMRTGASRYIVGFIWIFTTKPNLSKHNNSFSPETFLWFKIRVCFMLGPDTESQIQETVLILTLPMGEPTKSYVIQVRFIDYEIATIQETFSDRVNNFYI